MKDTRVDIMYGFCKEATGHTLLEEEKELQGLFPNMTDEQIEALAKLRYRYFRLGYQIGDAFTNYENMK